jgi:hypothetical protein
LRGRSEAQPGADVAGKGHDQISQRWRGRQLSLVQANDCRMTTLALANFVAPSRQTKRGRCKNNKFFFPTLESFVAYMTPPDLSSRDKTVARDGFTSPPCSRTAHLVCLTGLFTTNGGLSGSPGCAVGQHAAGMLLRRRVVMLRPLGGLPDRSSARTQRARRTWTVEARRTKYRWYCHWHHV